MNDIEMTKNSYDLVVAIGMIIGIVGIFFASWYKLKVHQAVIKDPRVMLRPKRWMWILGIIGIIVCVLYFVVWYIFFNSIDSI